MAADEELVYLNAAQAIELSRRRALSPRELMRAVIARAEAVVFRIAALEETEPLYGTKSMRPQLSSQVPSPDIAPGGGRGR